MKKIFTVLLAISLILVLTACACKHEWTEATCTEPKTCTKCGEVEGEALGHTWVDATCTEPKTCTVCGEVEGEPLGHEWVDATYFAPKTCAVCGITEGDCIEPEYERTGRSYTTMNLSDYCNEEFTYTTGKTLGSTTSVDVKGIANWAIIFDKTNENEDAVKFYIPSGIKPETIEYTDGTKTLQNVDGYEWRAIFVSLEPKNCYDIWGFEDYYTLQQYDENSKYYFDDDLRLTVSDFEVSFNGEEYDQCRLMSYSKFTNSNSMFCTFYRVPCGYDGCVFRLCDSRNYSEEESTVLNDDGAAYIATQHTGIGDVAFRLK